MSGGKIGGLPIPTYITARYNYLANYEEAYRSPIRVHFEFTDFPSNKEIEHALKAKLEMQQDRLIFLRNYYNGIHNVWNKEQTDSSTNKFEFRVMCNEPKSLTTTVKGFMFGNPICYSDSDQEDEIKELNKMFSRQKMAAVDMTLGEYQSCFGRGYEYSYYNDVPKLCSLAISPLNAEVIYSQDIEMKPKYAIYYYQKDEKDALTQKIIANYYVTVYTDKLAVEFKCDFKGKILNEIEGGRKVVKVGQIPIYEVMNNKDRIGDWEMQLPLIDAQNELLSDGVINISKLISSLLVLSSEDVESGNYTEKEREVFLAALKKNGVLHLNPGEAANYLTNALDQTSMNVLLQVIKKEIHTQSLIPDFDSDAFTADSSGYSKEFMLIKFGNLAKGKQSYYEQFLMNRLAIYKKEIDSITKKSLDIEDISIDFVLNLPANIEGFAPVLTSLSMSRLMAPEDILKLAPWIKDPQAVAKKAEEYYGKDGTDLDFPTTDFTPDKEDEKADKDKKKPTDQKADSA